MVVARAKAKARAKVHVGPVERMAINRKTVGSIKDIEDTLLRSFKSISTAGTRMNGMKTRRVGMTPIGIKKLVGMILLGGMIKEINQIQELPRQRLHLKLNQPLNNNKHLLKHNKDIDQLALFDGRTSSNKINMRNQTRRPMFSVPFNKSLQFKPSSRRLCSGSRS